jgi:hypothetical protein
VEDSPFEEHGRLVEQYGEERAEKANEDGAQESYPLCINQYGKGR